MCPKATWKGKDFLQLTTLRSHSIIQRNQGKSSRQEHRVGNWWGGPWLVPQDLLSLPSSRTQDHEFRGGTVHSALGLPTSFINHENMTCYRPIYSGLLHNWEPPSQIIQECYVPSWQKSNQHSYSPEHDSEYLLLKTLHSWVLWRN